MATTRWLKDLYNEHYQTLARLARSRLLTYCGTDTDAQDVLQDVFKLALEKNIRSHENPAGWLIKATENTCKNYARRRTSEMLRHTNTDHRDTEYRWSQLSTTTHEQEVDVLMTIERCLSEEEIQIINAYCIEKRSAVEVATTLGITPNALKVRVFRIRQRIRKFLLNHV